MNYHVWLNRMEAGAKNIGLSSVVDGQKHYALPVKDKKGAVRRARCQNCTAIGVVFQSTSNKDIYFLLCPTCGKYVSARTTGARKCRCGETLPAGRKKWCFKCRKPPAEKLKSFYVDVLEVQYNPGRVVLNIEGKEYTYHVDAGGINTFLDLMKKGQKGKAIAFLKSIKL